VQFFCLTGRTSRSEDMADFQSRR